MASVEPITEPTNPGTDPTPNIGDITPQPGKELDKDIECPLPSKQCRHTKITEELPDLKPLKDCPSIFPSTSVSSVPNRSDRSYVSQLH